ncbi:ATP-binding cassette domain-containing protein [Kitasatospora sp. NBC_00240]|uniref:ATP-binding cassette domain-containing protein n=1 Tax=Kitasatospora sp. NBC_00240 TaxID=2903567 RepID=UPI0022556917|nr:ATP-binding cassette domain-containing protein [Kitasatospora sp. NBC_00240]MCX5208772.1 ATP-binding cassette domain-containing protein [Kitasatospora sp. NBC_00240]
MTGADGVEPEVVIENVTFACEAGTWTALAGPAASGRTCVLRCAAGLDPLTTGEVRLAEGLRLAHVGLRPLTEQLAAVGTLASVLGRLPTEAAEQLREALHRLGLWEELDTPVLDLTEGRQRAAAVAVAIADGPDVLLADDLTGGLPPAAAAAVLDLLRDLVDRQGLCVLASAADLASLERADVVVLLAEGRVVETRVMP